VSEPTYRIHVTHSPINTTMPWQAAAFRITATGYDAYVDGTTCLGETSTEALCKVQRKLKLLTEKVEPQTFYADEDGELTDAPEPQSLRA
jgi:hypothetical protein